MDILARARALEQDGRDIIHMEIGEPDFATPAPVVEAGIRALRAGHTHYTTALGLPALREAISNFYQQRDRITVAPTRIVITPGASGALQLALALLLNPRDEVLLADPGYPCNRQLVRLAGGTAVGVPVEAASAFQPTAEQVQASWSPRTSALLLASPANPTGTLIAPAALRAVWKEVERCNGSLIMDEIYHGLVYGQAAPSALALSERVLVVNSFSKYFGMTGWRLGWLVAPEEAVPHLDRLAQNLFLAAPTPAQHAALSAFEPETLAILDDRRQEFARRRDYLVAALQSLGFRVPTMPGGAFYVYADCSRFGDSGQLARLLLEQAGVAVTPGGDFGYHRAAEHLRFAYTTSMAHLEEGVARLRSHLTGRFGGLVTDND